MKKHIGIDIDGTVADMLNTLKPYIFRINTRAKMKDIKDYALTGVGLNSEIMDNIFKSFRYKGDYLRMKPIRGSIKAIRELKDLGYKITFLSARDQYDAVFQETHDWLVKHKYKFDGVLCFQRNKIEPINEFKIDLLIDDNPNEIKEVSEKGIECLLFDQPWNKEIKETDKIKRVNNWKEVLNYIKC